MALTLEQLKNELTARGVATGATFKPSATEIAVFEHLFKTSEEYRLRIEELAGMEQIRFLPAIRAELLQIARKV